jgi:hypothetical protein
VPCHRTRRFVSPILWMTRVILGRSDVLGWVMPEALIFPLYVTLFIGGLIAFVIWWG